MTRKVSVTDCDYAALVLERQAVETASVTFHPTPFRPEEAVIANCFDAQGFLTRRVLSALPNLRVVARSGIDVDTTDVDAATELGITVCNVADYSVEEVSDHATALLLNLTRGVTRLDWDVRDGQWDFKQTQRLHRSPGQTSVWSATDTLVKPPPVKAKDSAGTP